MKVEFITYQCGDGKRYWTYSVLINGEEVKTVPLIYRMYDKEKTAIRNALKVIKLKTENLPKPQ